MSKKHSKRIHIPLKEKPSKFNEADESDITLLALIVFSGCRVNGKTCSCIMFMTLRNQEVTEDWTKYRANKEYAKIHQKWVSTPHKLNIHEEIMHKEQICTVIPRKTL